jgi:hypothetical protein
VLSEAQLVLSGVQLALSEVWPAPLEVWLAAFLWLDPSSVEPSETLLVAQALYLALQVPWQVSLTAFLLWDLPSVVP